MLSHASRRVLIGLGVVGILAGILAIYTYSQYKEYKRIGVSCGGDFSYVIKCPMGTMCSGIDPRIPQAGGTCQPAEPISSFLDFLLKA